MSEQTFAFRIIIEKPMPGALYGLQQGNGNSYETLQPQMAGSGNLLFDLSLPVRTDKAGQLVLHGPLVQGPPKQRFVYLDIGSYAGQEGAPVSGRLKVPLPEITNDMAQAARGGSLFLTMISGTREKDGRPTMGTVNPFAGWKIEQG
ncbi:hypothetical protein GCM10027341_22590 [Spirosoma knui]